VKIATYNVNGINGRCLEILLRWLKEDKPDVVCLQELKSTSFPEKEIARAGYGAAWEGGLNGCDLRSIDLAGESLGLVQNA
jgi:exodeoxyribonuclease-3